MINLAMFEIIVSLCTLGVVENQNGRWSSPVQMEIYKLECVEDYKACLGDSGFLDSNKLLECQKKRLESLKLRK